LFSEPIQEGFNNGKPFFVIEVSEKSKLGVLRRTKISEEHFNKILKSVFRE
jgi:hypothetical protein